VAAFGGDAISIDATFTAPPVDVLEQPLVYFPNNNETYSKQHLDGFRISAGVRWPGAVIYRVLGQGTGGFQLSEYPQVDLGGQVEWDDGEAEVRGYVEESAPSVFSGDGSLITVRYELEARATMRLSATIDLAASTLNRIAIRTACKPFITAVKWKVKNEETGEYDDAGSPFYGHQLFASKNLTEKIGEDSTPIVSGVVGTLVQNSFRVGGRAFAKFVSAPL